LFLGPFFLLMLVFEFKDHSKCFFLLNHISQEHEGEALESW
jgi:hypothetical protein